MFRKQFKLFFMLAVLITMLGAQSGQAAMAAAMASGRPVEKGLDFDYYNQPTNQMIVRYRDTANSMMQEGPASAAQALRLGSAAGERMTYAREMSGGAHVMRLGEKRSLAEMEAMAQRLMALPEVEYAEPDAIQYHTMEPTDNLYASQWNYSAPAWSNYGINAAAAWDITTGSTSVVVGVIDTGITNHAEFSGRIVPGYDFITDPAMANDGNGRDNDASDPGDWLELGDCDGQVIQFESSSWHGTHTAGTIGASANNGVGVVGVNWNARILPVRVLGKCGGYISDIADGMRWAAGLPVSGTPNNPNPAKVLSISLGGYGACDLTYQSAINAITAAGTTVVVAAGNSGSDASGFRPANCNGVITVAATDRYGGKAYYSNYGAYVEIAAPGGDTSSGKDGGILSTLNTGAKGPVADSYAYYQGTSMAAPHVAGVVSLLYSLKPAITPAEVLYTLQRTATAFPSSSTCYSAYSCGSGIVNAGAAVTAYADAGTTTAITAHASGEVAMGESTTVNFAVTPAAGGALNGTVTVRSGLDSCTGTAAAGSCVITYRSGGVRPIVATYSGDSTHGGSTSATEQQTVTAKMTYLPITTRTLATSPTYTGRITDNGAPVSGEVLTMYYADHGGDNYYASAVTASDGSYIFNTVPDIANGQSFYIMWRNNTYRPSWLILFLCNTVSNGNLQYKCDINVHDVAMKSPGNGAGVKLPSTFSWTARSTNTDSYWWTLYDSSLSYRMKVSKGVGYVTAWKLLSLPAADFIPNQTYNWSMDVQTPDGYGMGLYVRKVLFTSLNSVGMGNSEQ